MRSLNIQIPDYKNAKVLVIGDVVLDCYWHGKASKISPEAPVPVINHQKQEIRAGGAANVAMNLATLGASVEIIGVVGNDDEANKLKNILLEKNITVDFCINNNPTITKTRITSQNQQLLRVDNEILPNSSDEVVNKTKQKITNYDYIILSDYGKGALLEVEKIINLACENNKNILVDPKGNDFNKYKNSFLLTPNLLEFKQIVGEFSTEKELEEKALGLINDLNLNALLVTRSENGMSLFFKEGYKLIHKQHQTKAKEIFDVTGAGDTVIATLAGSLSAGSSLDDSVELSNLAAGVVVAKLGTSTLTMRELRKASYQSRFIRQGLVTQEQLLIELDTARFNDEKIVMTNGCFDILHTGHVNYLEQASKLGDRLVVAINTDESVARLKGPSRPANTLKSRASVLASLRCVDWVVEFTEDTPLNIIKACKPDFLVKGGDNNPENIVGAKEVKQNGGEVCVMPYVDGFSTTRTINKIQENK